MKDYEVTSEGEGFEEVPTPILIELMYNVFDELAERLEPRKPN